MLRSNHSAGPITSAALLDPDDTIVLMDRMCQEYAGANFGCRDAGSVIT